MFEALENEYRDTVSRMERLFENVTDDTAVRQPSMNRWSMLDCLGHLTSIGSVSETCRGFSHVQSEMLRLLGRMADQNTPRTWMPSPIIPAIILPLPGWFGMVAAHERRHLWQAEQVKQAVLQE